MNATEITVSVSGTEFPVKVYHDTVNDRGWVSGYITVRSADYLYVSRYDFEAKVYYEPSDNGINGGRISKLFVKDADPDMVFEVIGYDREWYLEPQRPQDEAALGAILAIFDMPNMTHMSYDIPSEWKVLV